MSTKYWFARNIRVGYEGHDRYRKGVMPIGWQGRAVIAGFVVAMVAWWPVDATDRALDQTFALGVHALSIRAVGQRLYLQPRRGRTAISSLPHSA